MPLLLLGDTCHIPSDDSGLYLAVLYFCSSRIMFSDQKKIDTQGNIIKENLNDKKKIYVPASGFWHDR